MSYEHPFNEANDDCGHLHCGGHVNVDDHRDDDFDAGLVTLDDDAFALESSR